jgi:hypothetical protein
LREITEKRPHKLARSNAGDNCAVGENERKIAEQLFINREATYYKLMESSKIIGVFDCERWKVEQPGREADDLVHDTVEQGVIGIAIYVSAAFTGFQLDVPSYFLFQLVAKQVKIAVFVSADQLKKSFCFIFFN